MIRLVYIVLKRLLLFPLMVVCLQCVSPLDGEQSRPPDILIVEGFIDDDFGPHEIEVSLLALFAGVTEGGERRRVVAEVSIVDELGNTTRLTREEFVRVDLQSAPGPGCGPFLSEQAASTNYFTPSDFRGIPGRSYSLEIVMPDGRMYKSRNERIPESPELDSVFVSFNSRPGDERGERITGLDVFMSWNDTPNEINYHFWQIGGTYSIQTPDIPGQCCIFDPRELENVDDCWVVERNITGTLQLFDDRLSNGGSLVENIGFIEDDGRRFSSVEVPPEKQYYVEVDQFTMSEAAFDYYKNVETLAELNGEIFDPPPVSALGNVVNVDDPSEQVVGFFGAFGKVTVGSFVNRNQLPEVKEHGVCGDCIAYAGGQLEVPEPYR